MLRHEFERDPVRERAGVDVRHVRAYPMFDGGGGVAVMIDVPHEPPMDEASSAAAPGEIATIKVWTRGSDGPELVPTLGSPDAVRTEATPCALEMPGAGFDRKHPPRYYAVSVQVVVGYDVVDTFKCTFDTHDGSPVTTPPF